MPAPSSLRRARTRRAILRAKKDWDRIVRIGAQSDALVKLNRANQRKRKKSHE